MPTNYNMSGRKYLVFFLASFLTLFVVYILIRSTGFNPSQSPINSSGELRDDQQDTVEATKQAWGKLLASHPYYNRTPVVEEESEEIPGADRPDLAFELRFMQTMDPALGAVPYERLYAASRELENSLKQRAPIPGLAWTERGPTNVGGRTRALLFDPNDATKKKVWAGGVGGGLWVTTDITIASPVWTKVNDFWSNIAVTTIAYNPANTQEIYVGTGEGWFNSDAQSGSGIWKTTNGGGAWTNLATTIPGAYNSSSDFHYIQKIVCKNDGTVYAATRGYYTNTGGIMRSTNGGTAWTKVLTVWTGSGSLYDRAADVEVAANGDVFASFGMSSTGKVFKTTNASNGAAWTDLSTNVGVGSAERIELACAPSNASVIYAVGEGGSGFNDIAWFKRSVDGGTVWNSLAIPRLVDDGVTHFTNGQAFYNLIVAVHATNADLVLAGGLNLHRSTNGGTSWTGISDWNGNFSQPYVHADQHAIVFRPGAPNEVLFGNDGGLFFSTNAGNSAVTPSFAEKNTGYNVTQLYACASKNEFNSNFFLGGCQDNGTQQFTLPQANTTDRVVGGDGAFCHIDQLDGDMQLASYVYNSLYRSVDGGWTFNEIMDQGSGHFINPSEYDNVRKVYYAACSNDSLKRIPNINVFTLNVNPPSSDLGLSVGASKISALKVSPYNDVLFLGIANGRVYKLANASTVLPVPMPVPTRLDNGAGAPITTAGWVSSIDVGEDDNHLMVTYSNYGVTSIWETSNGGLNWFNKEGNLPDIPVNWAIYNPSDRNQVLAATEIGVYSTGNFGHNTSSAPVWGTAANAGPVLTRCDMLKLRASDKMVVVATHGRGLFTTDIFATSSVADFTADVTTTCSNSLTVHFYDASFKPNGSWAWDIDNNGVTNYTTQNPTHTYSVPGTYSVKLTVNAGATSITKLNYIKVMNSTPTVNTGCTLVSNINLNNTAAIGIYRFALGSIDKLTSFNDGFYQNYACTAGTTMELNTLYNVTVQTGYANDEGARFYIDYNDNGTFESGESAVSFPANKDGTRTLSFTTPVNGVVTRKNLRSRILSRFAVTPTNACDIATHGQAEDYAVYFNCNLLVTLTSGTAVGSLISAVNCANNGDTIRISSTLANSTINVGSSTLALTKNLVIIAQGANTNITGTGTSVFDIAAGKTVELQTMTLTAGTSLTAGAINNNGILKMNNVVIHRNTGISNAILLRNTPGSSSTMIGMCFVWN
ncbi:MAG TPA: GEVED domain-containing protein [Saprospiraceae bacterium]|nr:GEVED domain-containing protein [Saprospiraceae bacterium]